MLFFCRRGRQNLRQLKKDDLEIQTDAKGRRFVVKTTDELTKNHRENDEAEDGGIMMSNEGSLCPVPSFEKYLSHLNPANDYLFQRPKTRQVSDSEVWYDNMVLGEHTLGKKMKVLSQRTSYFVYHLYQPLDKSNSRNHLWPKWIWSSSYYVCKRSSKRE